jgi:hypothetical protein
VILAPGVYYLRTPIDFPSYYTLDAEGDATMYFRTLRGYGAILVRSWDVGSEKFVTPFFRFVQQNPDPNRDHVTFEGLTFMAERRPYGVPGGLPPPPPPTPPADATVALITNNPPDAASTGTLSNFTLRRCVFRNVQLGVWAKPGLWAEDCLWTDGGGCSQMQGPALWLRCTFRGLIDPVYGQAWSGVGGGPAGSGMAVLDCDFIGTDRGPILQATYGDVTDNLFSGVICDQIGLVNNGCEIAVEGRLPNRGDNNLYFHIRYRGEGHGLLLNAVACSGNILRDFVFHGGYGLQFSGVDATHPVSNNTILEGEVRGGRCQFNANATGNIMKNVGFVGPRPTQGSVFAVWGDPNPDFDPPVTGQAVITNLSGNQQIDYDPQTGAGTIKFARLLDGWMPTQPAA